MLAPRSDTDLLTASESAAFLRISTGTLYNHRNSGDFAPAIVLGSSRALRWEAQDLLEWARARKEAISR